MGAAHSNDLRIRVVAEVAAGRMSRRKAAAHFRVSAASAVRWVELKEETGDISPRPRGGKSRSPLEPHAAWLWVSFAQPHDMYQENLWRICHISGFWIVMIVGTNGRKPTMTAARLELFAAAPSLMKEWQRAMFALDAASSLGSGLSELVKIRASQINGCANCVNLHATAARESGETEQRVYLLSAWREAPCYSDRERAALSWTEALTRLSEGHTHESAYEVLKAEFTDEERVKLTLLINIINGYNRLAVGFGGWVDPAAIKSAAKAAAA